MKAQEPGRRKIGVGTIVSVVIALLFGLWNVKQEQSIRMIYNKDTNMEFSFKPPKPPEFASIPAESETLSLTPDQAKRVKAIVQEWETASKPIVDAMKREAGEFDVWMRSRENDPPGLDELQKRAEPESRATQSYLALQNKFRKRAESTLTPTQRDAWERILKEREKRYVNTSKPKEQTK